MKVVFCGTVVPEKIELKTPSISAAGNRFQINFIKGLQEAGHTVIQYSFLGMPLDKNICEEIQCYEENEKKFYFKKDGFIKSIRKYGKDIKQAMHKSDVVICYNIIYAWLLLPVWANKKNSIVILADYTESESYHSLYKKVYAHLQKWSMRKYKVVVGLSANIEKKLKPRQQFILMEGGIEKKFYDAFSYREHKAEEPWIFMYSGLLSRVTGVDLLLNSMLSLKRQDVKLIITGKGDLEDEVREAAEKDKRIIYLGHLSYEEYMEQLQGADALINPRNMTLPENQNNFPSKIMDYLATGKVIISTKFVGWEKFKDNIFFLDSTSEALTQRMEELEKIDNDTVYNKNRKKAMQFIWKEQIKRILDKR